MSRYKTFWFFLIMHNFIISVEIPTLKFVDVLDVSMLGKNILEILYYRFEEITLTTLS